MYTKLSFQYNHLDVVNNKLLLYSSANFCCNTIIFAEPWKPSVQNCAFYTGNPFHKQPTNSFLQIMSFFFFFNFLSSEEFPTTGTSVFVFWYVPIVNSCLTLWPQHSKISRRCQVCLCLFKSPPLPWQSLQNQIEGGAISFQTTSTPSHTTSVSLSWPSLPENFQWRSKWHQTIQSQHGSLWEVEGTIHHWIQQFFGLFRHHLCR